ncbi:MAG: tetraacyldisaccharide 4'-kinase [Caulobacteraceae bacterium]
MAWLLWPVSLAFGLLVIVRRLAYALRLLPSTRVPVPVVVIGNLTVGGSGKTPLAIHVAELLKAKGWSPAIVSRGYGGTATEPRSVSLASDPAEMGDEPVLMARRSGCPVWVGARRAAVVETLLRETPRCNLVILDDGLQHYALRRDLEICVVDARAFGNDFMLPAGPLREPRMRLWSVDAVIAHGTDRVKGYPMVLEGEEVHRATDARDRRNLKSFAGERVHAVAGIGDPKRFFLQLARHGLKVVPHPFPDHHPFVDADLDFGDDAPVLMTEKDAVKCKRFAKPAHWILPVRAAPDPAFDAWLLRRLDELGFGPKVA